MSTRSRHLGAALCILFTSWSAVSCDLTGPEWITRPGYLEHFSSPPLVDLPQEARIADSLAIVVDTYGSGCTRAGETLVEYPEPMIVSITPLDTYPGPGSEGACPTSLNTFRHEANVSFNGVGEAMVLIRGRRLSGEGEEELVLERSLTITAN